MRAAKEAVKCLGKLTANCSKLEMRQDTATPTANCICTAPLGEPLTLSDMPSITSNLAALPRWSLAGKRALVTGGTKGIGAAVVAELLALGARVVTVARNSDDITASVARWHEAGSDAHGVAADVSTPDGRAALMDFAGETLGGLDILVNNVGTNIRRKSLDYTPDEYEKVFHTNVAATWEMCRLSHPHLSRSGDSAIVTIGSVAGSSAIGSGAPYAMTKAALDQLARYLASEWAGDGIRVNNVNPWYTRTPLAAPVLDGPVRDRVLARTPNGRIAEAEDIAGLVAFLCLPVARHITGQTIAVDGGFLAGAFVAG